MPTRDEINGMNYELVKEHLERLLGSSDYCPVLKMQYLYEIGIILLAKQQGLRKANGLHVTDEYPAWRELATLRNVLAHGTYNYLTCWITLTLCRYNSVVSKCANDIDINTGYVKIIEEGLLGIETQYRGYLMARINGM